MELSAEYWNSRYQNGQTGWDIGEVSLPLKNYIDQLTDKKIRILIPGCGNAHEAFYLLQQGFENVTCMDISTQACASLKQHPKASGLKIVCADFFDHRDTYDLVLEQTFFCAIDPSLREAYARHMALLLVPGGKLSGVFFNCRFEKEGPPFGGDANEYREYFEPYFVFRHFSPCLHSIAPRAGNELFAVLVRK